MPLNIVKNDITKVNADAIINAANTDLQQGGGVCGAIFAAAGAEKLRAACNALAPIKTGEAVITPGFGLQAKYIIHAVGPIYNQWNPADNRKLLRSAYINALKLAVKNNCESIAFPLISSGIYGYPPKEALKIATKAIKDFLEVRDIGVTLVIYDKQSFVVSKQLTRNVQNYINMKAAAIAAKDALTWAGDKIDRIRYPRKKSFYGKGLNAVVRPIKEEAKSELEELLGKIDESFSMTLLKLIDAKGKTDSEVYKKANIDRKLFSKIRTGNNGYIPRKRTVLALAVALELTIEETEALLLKAGYALSNGQKFDVIVSYFIANKKYDIFEINNILFSYDQPLLGS